MLNATRVTELELELAVARKDAQPVIVEKVSESADEVVYINKTHGTTRKDMLGGEPVRYEDRPVAPVEEPIWSKLFDASVGKVTKQTESDRTIQLVSGTVRQDHK